VTELKHATCAVSGSTVADRSHVSLLELHQLHREFRQQGRQEAMLVVAKCHIRGRNLDLNSLEEANILRHTAAVSQSIQLARRPSVAPDRC